MPFHKNMPGHFRRLVSRALAVICVCVFSLSTGAGAAAVRLGVVQAGDYAGHVAMRGAVLNELRAMLPDSFRVETPPDAYVNAEWDRAGCRERIRKLVDDDHADVILAMGPWVVEDLLEAGFRKPVVAAYRFDPIAEGLVDSTGRPIAENLTVTLYPDRYSRDFSALSSLFAIDTVAVICFDSNGETERLLERMRQSIGGQKIELVVSSGYTPRGEFAFFNAYQKVPPGADAVYISPLWGVQPDAIRPFFERSNSVRRPVFASDGAYPVGRGALASDAGRTMMAEAVITAWKLKRIVEGISPADLPTAYEQARGLTVNADVAASCGVALDGSVADVLTIRPAADRGEFYDYTAALATAYSRRSHAASPPDRIALEADVSEAYLSLAHALETVRIDAEVLAVIDVFRERAHGAAQVGLAQPETLTRLQARRALLEAALITSQSSKRTAAARLAESMDFPPTYALFIDTTVFSERVQASLYVRLSRLVSHEQFRSGLLERLADEAARTAAATTGADDLRGAIYAALLEIERTLLAGVPLRRAEDDSRSYLQRLIEAPSVSDRDKIDALDAGRAARMAALDNRMAFFRACARLAYVVGWSMNELNTTPAQQLLRFISSGESGG
ncbi:MAG: ABC transporter substrate binding protein [candidate division Zixibacteria bacterium]|jgi:ABC-type uncharacterized transport system substrate-binding protein|nr:ABC transporter substrate binding protein [candidate division Zixibacteria bacterium]